MSRYRWFARIFGLPPLDLQLEIRRLDRRQISYFSGNGYRLIRFINSLIRTERYNDVVVNNRERIFARGDGLTEIVLEGSLKIELADGVENADIGYIVTAYIGRLRNGNRGLEKGLRSARKNFHALEAVVAAVHDVDGAVRPDRYPLGILKLAVSFPHSEPRGAQKVSHAVEFLKTLSEG